jgi:hypothetical protein
MRQLLAVAAALVLAACSSFGYDLSPVPFDVSAKPAPAGARTQPFTVRGKTVLWVYGLCGEALPDVAAWLREQCPDGEQVADFHVSVAASFHDWLLTHLTLGFVRMKTVTVTGVRVAERP